MIRTGLNWFLTYHPEDLDMMCETYGRTSSYVWTMSFLKDISDSDAKVLWELAKDKLAKRKIIEPAEDDDGDI